ncbi:hypothetical protein GCM10022237_29720 [Nocardioides ginsengisoli]|uniref:TolB family protein n=1 Tax=Nocardioides ginsengisoli TaxID=363868 RepID=A0ABW3VUY2_9ACTN
MLHRTLRELVGVHGPGWLEDADDLRGVLEDVVGEGDATPAELRLLVDTVRYGALPRLAGLLADHAAPAAAITAATDLLVTQTGADRDRARWAVATLGFARGLVPEELVVVDRPVDEPAPSPPPPPPPAPPPAPVTRPTPRTVVPVPEPEPGPEPAPVRRRRGRSLLAGLVGLLLLAGAVTALWLGGSGDPDPDPEAGPGPTSPTTSPPTAASTGPTGPTVPTDAPPPAPTGFVAYATRTGATSTVRVLDLSTGRSRLVASEGSASEPSVSADGRTVAYVRTDGDGRRIVVDHGHGTPQVLDVGRDPRSPAIAPDGRAVAYVVATAGGQDVVLRDLGATVARPVAAGSADERDPTWSADGARLAYVLSGSTDDTVVTLDATDLTEISRTVTAGHARSPALSPDGDDVAYVAGVQGNADVVVAPLGSADPDAGRNLSQSGETELGLIWLADGRLVSSATGRGLVAIEPGTGATEPLTSGATDAL